MQATSFSPEYLERQSDCLTRAVRRRNRIEYAAAGLVAAFFGLNALGLFGMPEGSAQAFTHVAGSLLMVAGAAVVAWQLHVRASATPANPGATGTFSYHMAALKRQRDALRAVWLWYVGPLIPGFAVLFAGAWLNPAADKGVLALIQAIIVLVLAGVLWLNRRAAARMQREIDRLESERE
ncbi:MAG: hypothetical protein JJ913_07240 [Rhizobiaceae bacterium]|nr:hypothetical protein [Rhizobiaceae bacterium]